MDATTNGTTGGGGQDTLPTETKTGGEWAGLGGYVHVPPPQLGETGLGPPGRARGTHADTGGRTDGYERAGGDNPPTQLEGWGRGPQRGT